MFANRRSFIVMLLFVLVLSVACGGQTEFEPTVSPAESTAVAQAPQMGPITPFGAPEVRDLSPTSEVVPNCDGVTSPVVKHPSMTVGSSHTVEWQVGGSVGTGVTIGGGVVPGGVDLQATLEGHVANDLTNSIQQSNAWDLPADPGTIMEYTIMWREVWQPAYLDVTFMDPEPEIIKIDVKYRTGVQSEIVGSKATPCDPGALTQVEPATAELPPANTPAPPSSGITAAQLDGLFGSGNWFCFPDRNNGVGVKMMPINFSVVAPLRYVDTFRGRFPVGQTELGGTGGTAELITTLLSDQCPGWQQSALSAWRADRSTESQITSATQLDALFGQGNWACLSDYPFGATVHYLNADLSIKYPFSTADANEYKYGVGEVIPAGSALTVWFAGSIPREQCP